MRMLLLLEWTSSRSAAEIPLKLECDRYVSPRLVSGLSHQTFRALYSLNHAPDHEDRLTELRP